MQPCMKALLILFGLTTLAAETGPSIAHFDSGKLTYLECSPHPTSPPASPELDQLCGLNGKRSRVSIYAKSFSGRDQEKFRLVKVETYLNGVRDGVSKEYSPDSVTETHYAKGKRHGLSCRKRNDGLTLSETKYENGEEIYRLQYEYRNKKELYSVYWSFTEDQQGNRPYGSINLTRQGKMATLNCGSEPPPYAPARKACGFGGKPVLNRFFSDGGDLREEVSYLDGKARGPRKRYEKGKLVQVTDEEKGRTENYHANGKIYMITGRGKENEYASLSYNEKGQLTRLLCADKSVLPEDKKLCGFNGKTSGVTLYYFGQKGGVHEKLQFLNGKLEGRTEQFGEDGKLKSVDIYRAGKRDGTSRSYYPGTDTLQREAEYRDNRATTEKNYYQNGKLKSEKTFDLEGDTYLLIEYGDLGGVLARGKFRGRTPVGEHVESGYGGQCLSRYDEDGHLDGEQQCEDPTSGEKTTTLYQKGNVSRKKVFDRSGRLVEDTEVFPDGSRKIHQPRDTKPGSEA